MASLLERWRPKVLAFSFSSLLVLLVLGAGEIFCRVFLDINLRKTSVEFVRQDANGFIVGNAPNATGTSFGVEVYSDANGYRVPQNYVARHADSSVLLIGDSVTFGVGVLEEQTFAGRLRSAFPEREILNSGVVGYSIPDYVRLVNSDPAAQANVRQVYLFYCLNDFHSADVYEPRPVAPGAWPSIKRGIASAFVWINETLGPRSKLYVLVTGLTIDPSRQYYEGDAKGMEVSDEKFAQVAQPLVEIGRKIQGQGKSFAVVLNPYEMQVRPNSGADFRPQDRMKAFLATNGIDVIDTRDRFLALDAPSKAFLFADPMHLSALGHEIVFDVIAQDLRTLDTK